MKIINGIKKRKYLYKIIILFTIVLFIIISIFALIISYNINNNVLNNEYEHNMKLLHQIKLNIDSMNETARNLCTFVYYNIDTKALMMSRGDDENYYEFMKSLLRIGNIPDAISFIDSVYIYNNITKTYYSTKGVFEDKTIKEDLLSSYKSIPVLEPVLRKVGIDEKANGDNGYTLSYFMYDYKDKDNYMDGGVILNVRPEWLYKNINIFSASNNFKQDTIFIVDGKGECILDNKNKQKQMISFDDIYDAYKENIKATDDNFGFFKNKTNNIEYNITYINLENADWTIMKVQPGTEVFGYVYQLKTSLIIITIVLLLLALVIIISVSRTIYKPIGNLVKQLDIDLIKKLNIGDSKDELFCLNQIYKYSVDQLRLFSDEINSNRGIMRSYFLKNLLIDSISISNEEIDKYKEEKYISIALNTGLAICILKIDNYNDLITRLSLEDRNLYKFAIINVASEVFSNSFKNEAIEMNSDQIAFIVEINTESNYLSTLIKAAKQIQEYLYSYYKISMTFAISEFVKDRLELTKYYRKTLDYIAYRCVFGSMSILTHQTVKSNINNLHFNYPFLIEKRLVEEIRSSNINKIDESLKAIFSEISKLNYNNIMLSLMNLLNTIKNTVDEMNQRKFDTVNINFENLLQQLYDMETLEELHVKLMDVFKSLPEGERNSKNEKGEVLVETIKNIILKNFSNNNLCLAEIASMLKLSQQYASRVFKDITGTSVAGYINDVRLTKVIVLLENTKLSINHILESVGIENETYFYRIFKKRYGTTPREYITKINQERRQ